MSPERTREKVAWVKEAAGSRFGDLELNANGDIVGVGGPANGKAPVSETAGGAGYDGDDSSPASGP